MHELPIIERVLDLALASAPPGDRIVTVKLRVGALCDAEPEWLQRYFRVAARETAAEDARLEITRDDAVVHCPSCGKESLLVLPLTGSLSCSLCGYDHVTLVAGMEYQLESIEVTPEADQEKGP
ncbi:MAG: hydrogenase maturation nickel metallochaperone HypA [Spirochaetia bacterium]|jgi:hydrogenase nickel incorporation protein HypA/HybF|nr:hydrogenase maturation nickel metallochaperone HypA [Spirochaetia bacterium]